MVSAAPPLALQPLARALPAPVSLAALVGLPAAASCDSCRSAPAAFTLTWPDARFRVCSTSLPESMPAGSVLGLVAPHAAGGPAASATAAPAGSAAPQAADRARLASATTALAVTVPADLPQLLATRMEGAEGDVLRAAAHTVLTSPPSTRGRRLSCDGGCDVVAALVLAYGGAVDEFGRPADPTERPAVRLLRKALHRLADQLAGCAPGRPWDGDPVALIDAWQADRSLTRSARAAALGEAAERPPAWPSSSTTSAAKAVRKHSDGSAVPRRPQPRSTATPGPRCTGARS